MTSKNLFSRSWRALWVLSLLGLVGGYWGQRAVGGSEAVQAVSEVGRDAADVAHRRGTLVTGEGSGRLTVFMTYSCVYCRELLETIESGREGGQVEAQVHVRHLVPPDADGYSTLAAVALECGARQERAAAVHNVLIAGDRFSTIEGLIAALQSVEGLDLAVIEACAVDSGVRQSLAMDFQDAVALGIRGTPTSFYEDRTVRGAGSLQLVIELIEGNYGTQQ